MLIESDLARRPMKINREMLRPSQSGVTLVELMIGIGVMITVIAITMSQMQQISMFFSSLTAESSVKSDVGQAANLFEGYFQTKWKGGVFECSSAPRIGQDSYCVKASDCESVTGSTFKNCRSIAIIRGDPADASTNPDRVRITTSCLTATAETQKNLEFKDSVCNLECAKGTYPVTTFETTKANGTTTTFTFPGGVTSGQEIVSTAETRALELCLSKPFASAVTVDVQGYYLQGSDLKVVKKQLSLPETTSTNTNIEFLP